MLPSGTLPSRVIAILLLALFLLIGYQAIIQPIIDLYHENAATIATQQDRLQRYRRLAGERETLVDQLSRLQQDRRSIAGYIEKSSDTMAATAVQDRATGAISAVGGDVKSVELLPGEAVEGHPSVRRVGLRVRFSASIKGLASVVRTLEDAEPYLFIGSLLVNAAGGGLNTNRQEQGRQLDVSLDVIGYAQAPSQVVDHGT